MMMETIKAIETEYKGYKFRSRLESRWAVFFDEANIKYSYEPEGFELGDGIRYLPDFYLPEYEVFVEVKPVLSSKSDWMEIRKEWIDKCSLFRTVTGNAILLVFGDPAEDVWGRLFAWKISGDKLSELSELDSNAIFTGLGYQKPDIIILTTGDNDERVCINPNRKINKNVLNTIMLVIYQWEYAENLLGESFYHFFDPNSPEGTFDYMRKKARQARFEYGEGGN